MPILIGVDAAGKAGIFPPNLGAQLRDISRALPGKRRWKAGTLWFDLSRANIEWVRENLPDARYSDPARLEAVMAAEAMEEVARQAKVEELPPEASAFAYKTEPRKHQRKTFMVSRDRKAYGLWLEQGLGKTKVILDTAAYLWAEGAINILLVTAPNGVHAQWIEEQLPIHLPDWVPRRTLIYTSNQTKRWLAEADAVLGFEDGLIVVGMNIEAFSSLTGVAFARRVLATGSVLWAVDESTGIKTPGVKRTKNVLKLRDSAPYRRVLSGTPVTKGIEDLYTQLKWLDDDVHGYGTFTEFRNHYCVTTPNPFAPGAVRIVGYKNVEELQRRMDAYCMRLTVAECLDLPPINPMIRYVELTDEQRRHYKEVRDQLITQLASGAIVTAEQAITKLLRLQQIVCGHVKDELGISHRIPSNRANDALAAIEPTDGKALLWGRFHEDIDILMEAFTAAGYSPVQYDGRVGKLERKENKRRFIADPKCGPFIANPEAAAIGMDGLQHAARTMLFYSNSFKAYMRWQAESRLQRDGTTGTVTAIDQCARGTVDAYIRAALRHREDIANLALRITPAQLDGALTNPA